MGPRRGAVTRIYKAFRNSGKSFRKKGKGRGSKRGRGRKGLRSKRTRLGTTPGLGRQGGHSRFTKSLIRHRGPRHNKAEQFTTLRSTGALYVQSAQNEQFTNSKCFLYGTPLSVTDGTDMFTMFQQYLGIGSAEPPLNKNIILHDTHVKFDLVSASNNLLHVVIRDIIYKKDVYNTSVIADPTQLWNEARANEQVGDSVTSPGANPADYKMFNKCVRVLKTTNHTLNPGQKIHHEIHTKENYLSEPNEWNNAARRLDVIAGHTYGIMITVRGDPVNELNQYNVGIGQARINVCWDFRARLYNRASTNRKTFRMVNYVDPLMTMEIPAMVNDDTGQVALVSHS